MAKQANDEENIKHRTRAKKGGEVIVLAVVATTYLLRPRTT